MSDVQQSIKKKENPASADRTSAFHPRLIIMAVQEKRGVRCWLSHLVTKSAGAQQLKGI